MIAPNYPPEKQKSAMPKRPNMIWVLADQLRAQAQRSFGRHATARLEIVAQRAALQEIHHHEVVVVLDTDVDDTHDVRMLQAPSRTRLALEARHDILVVDQVPV